VDLTIRERTLRFARPVETSYGAFDERVIFEVDVTDAEGRTGCGEAAPLEPYDGVSAKRVCDALDAYRTALARHRPGGRHTMLDACRAVDELPQALASIDLAMWDLVGKRSGRPVCQLLSEAPVSAVPVNASITAEDPGEAAAAAHAAVAACYSTLKLKVGTARDRERVERVREAVGPGPLLRLDANGAWTVEQAERAIAALSPFGLELVEEPVHGLSATRELRARVPARIAIDETAATPGALTARVADAVCLKISRCGGIGGLLAAASLVRATGAEVYLASTYDGPCGIAAAVHAAAALAPLPACGLATLELFDEPPRALTASRGEIAVPARPGLGI
jgi:L-alanine-DL-glutamate epimerase-like enolase superfamily enzyme